MRARGFSLVEAVVAALLLVTGLLALAAAARAVQRLDLLADRSAEAAEVAASRLARLRTGCAGASGASASGAMSETWTVAGAGALRVADVGVTFTHDARPRVLRFSGSWRCGGAP